MTEQSKINSKIIKLIDESNVLVREYVPPIDSRFCGREKYQLSKNVSISRGLNASKIWKVVYNNTKIGEIDHDLVASKIIEKKESIKKNNLNIFLLD